MNELELVEMVYVRPSLDQKSVIDYRTDAQLLSEPGDVHIDSTDIIVNHIVYDQSLVVTDTNTPTKIKF